jgi:hypothetical protein
MVPVFSLWCIVMTNVHPDSNAGAAAPDSQTQDAAATSAIPRLAVGPLLILFAAVPAALIGWTMFPVGTVDFQESLIPPSESLQAALNAASSNAGRPRALTDEENALYQQWQVINSALVFAIFGGIYGGLAGFLEGARRLSFVRALVGLVGGLVLGAVLGGAGGYVANVMHRLDLPQLIPLAKTMVVQSMLWGMFGAGVGLALALPSRSGRVVGLTVAGGIVGGVLAAVVYCFAWPIFLPQVPTELVAPLRKDHRILWLLFHFVVLGMVAAWQGRSLPRPPRRNR